MEHRRMKYLLSVRRAVLLATTCALLQQGGLALAGEGAGSADSVPVVGTRPAMNALTPQPVAEALKMAATSGSVAPAETGGDAQGNVAELMQMIHDSQLTELRTTYNGSYGASLFFYPQEMTYYVALFQNKHFWRVVKSEDDTRAEAVYANFVRQTAQLADVEIRRTRLQAQKAFIEDVIALSEDRAKRLQADLDVARTQQAKVNDYQRQTQAEAAALRAQKEQAQAELRQVQSQVQRLQRQTEYDLPGTK
jgi:RecA/RadA recombinase